ncbi:MAG: ExbD/TolR family protein [Pseudomonadota bacterium]
MGAAVTGPKSRSRRGRTRSAPMSEINVTPFVDVMLVLLIIFMVAAPLLTVGVPLELPKTTAEALPTEQEEPLTVNIDADGGVYLQEEPVEYAVLPGKLAAIREARGEGGGKVFLRADGGLAYARVAQVMAELRNAGFNAIGLITDQAPRADE